jgi:lysozyme
MVVGLAMWVAWRWYLPGYRPSLAPGERYGIDVSHHQGRIDWTRVAGNRIGFAYLKATEGGDYVDPTFAENWAAARRAGIEVGAYHFFTLCRPGADQAANFLAALPTDASALPAAIDLEFSSGCKQRPTRDVLLREVTTFVKTVETRTHRPMLVYAVAEFEARYPVTEVLNRPTWQRRIFRRPNNNRWRIWQVHGFARIAGIHGPVDLNIGR